MSLRDKIIAAAMAVSMAACGQATDDKVTPDGPNPNDEATAPVGKGSGKADAWDVRNDPRRMADFLDKELEYKLDALPAEGRANNTPWADTYWPTYADSTNHRWYKTGGAEVTIDNLSPLEKYDLAFNGWVMPDGFLDLKPFDGENCNANWDREYYTSLGPAARYQSENKGNKNSRDGVDSNGDGVVDECGTDDNDGVEFWWGLCHAWVPAALNEPEPLHPVTVNGVTFRSSDVKALLQTLYDRSKSIIVGGRCNTKEVERDEHGRIKADECRDTNAGSFHVLMTNMLGRYGLPIAEDRTYDYQVWNQPIYDYKVEHQEEVDEAKALQILQRTDVTKYPYNDKAKRFAEVRMTVRYVTESHASEVPNTDHIETYLRTDRYQYLLEMDADGKILGGEWLKGRTEHPVYGVSEQPDFLWTSTGPAVGAYGVNPHIDYEKVKELIAKSRQVDDGGGDDDDTGRVTFDSAPAAAIPDNDTAGVTDSITIDDERIADRVVVQVDITHTYVGDLKIALYKDGGEAIVLRDGQGGSGDNIHEQLEATALNGKSLKGTYKLVVTDSARIDTGTLDTWAIIAEVQ